MFSTIEDISITTYRLIYTLYKLIGMVLPTDRQVMPQWSTFTFVGEDDKANLTRELSSTKDKLQRAEEKKAEREELKAHLKRVKETNKIQKTEIEDIRKDLSEHMHERMMSQ